MDKKTAINHLIEKGKAAGKLSTQDIDSLIIEYDFEIDELDKLYELIEQNGIEVADDMSETALDALSFDSDIAKAYDTGEDSKNLAMDDPVKVYLKEIGKIPLLTPEKLTLPCVSVRTIRRQNTVWRRLTSVWWSA